MAGSSTLYRRPTLAQIRAATTAWLPNQMLGYAMNWSLGVQHEFAHDYTLEVRYVGTGVHLIEQTELNRERDRDSVAVPADVSRCAVSGDVEQLCP